MILGVLPNSTNLRFWGSPPLSLHKRGDGFIKQSGNKQSRTQMSVFILLVSSEIAEVLAHHILYSHLSHTSSTVISISWQKPIYISYVKMHSSKSHYLMLCWRRGKHICFEFINSETTLTPCWRILRGKPKFPVKCTVNCVLKISTSIHVQ